ncbi:MAG: YcgL domain-containing protein [Pseudomonadales bacterium]|jgi:hypothetical protein|nr:YcgL domain-containing protein [Pseudomonadales bacterium]MDP6471746.1 YcgL domain-containing protein [Pseudomonadales bacterium]MDP6971422.1 YcgL domain-containing protein [Pseudomonadales bacterium]|tara:strand:- start:4649 stop:4960 length:312 start_codon:yes stop_codon:yes gene_type:complete
MIEVAVYKGSKREGMYLYVRATDELEQVSKELLAQFGTPVEVLKFELNARRQLAHADGAVVMAAIEEKGFYLQMPPTPAELEAELARQLGVNGNTASSPDTEV